MPASTLRMGVRAENMTMCCYLVVIELVLTGNNIRND